MTPDTVQALPDPTARARRALSHALFGGARYRIEIGAAVAEQRRVTTTGLAAQLDLPRQSVNQELHVLERCGLVVRREDSARQLTFEAQRSGYWAWCAEAAAHAEEMLGRMPRF